MLKGSHRCPTLLLLLRRNERYVEPCCERPLLDPNNVPRPLSEYSVVRASLPKRAPWPPSECSVALLCCISLDKGWIFRGTHSSWWKMYYYPTARSLSTAIIAMLRGYRSLQQLQCPGECSGASECQVWPVSSTDLPIGVTDTRFFGSPTGNWTSSRLPSNPCCLVSNIPIRPRTLPIQTIYEIRYGQCNPLRTFSSQDSEVVNRTPWSSFNSIGPRQPIASLSLISVLEGV